MERCPLYKKCGGCQLQNMTYPEQLLYKQRLTVKLLGRFARVSDIIGMENPYHYRNKVQAAFGYDRARRRIISGVYQSGTHRIVPVDTCLTEDEKADEIIVCVRNLCKDFNLQAYNEDTKKGLMRHVLVKRGFSTNEIMVVLVTGTVIFPRRNDFVKALLQKHPEITTVIHNINDTNTNLVLGKRETVLFGKGYITDRLLGCNFRISASSFYQINPVQTEVLYRTAIEFAGLSGKERVLDSYCGTGTIGLIAAKNGAKSVIGVELNADAVRDAKANAKENGVTNIRFYCGDAGRFLDELSDAGEPLDVVLMDPPRAGSTEKFLHSVLKIAPKRVVYVSCNPETLARDLYRLVKGGYRVQKIQPVDMFPHTGHIECVVLLQRGRKNSQKSNGAEAK